MTYLSVWKQDFRECERLPEQAVAELISLGIVRTAWKPNRKGKLKPVLISLDVLSKIRDLSASMPPRVTVQAAMGNRRYMALVEAWRCRA